MWIQKVIGSLFLTLLCLQQVKTVVNNGIKEIDYLVLNTTVEKNNTIDNDNSNSINADNVAESSEQKPVRREALHGIGVLYGPPSNAYGAPVDSYVPSIPSNVGLPIPTYGVPDAPSNNIIYPAPPPDVPPSLPQTYGVSAITPHFSPPKQFSSVKFNSHVLRSHKPLAFPKPVYGPPPYYGHKHQYGLPRPLFNVYKSKPIVNPPKFHYGPPKPLYLPYKLGATYGLPQVYVPPKVIYGPPKITHVSTSSLKYYPDPVPHGPPPGVPAPPTPPDIKYDGWQPIPGLISRPPSDTYGAPQVQHVGNQQYNVDLVPPPTNVYQKPHGISDSYNAPLSTVTGSGGIVGTSGNDHASRGTDHSDGGVSVVKSIGYEILSAPKPGGGTVYTTAPIPSYTQTNDNIYNLNELSSTLDSFSNVLSSSFESTLNGGNVFGLIPPSGVYGLPPSGSYGTPLLQKQTFGANIDSEYKPALIGEIEPNAPSTLYSLPNNKNPTSFQNYVQGSFNSGLQSTYNDNSPTSLPITSYTAPLSVVDSSYVYPQSDGALTTDSNFGASQTYSSSISGNYAVPYVKYQSSGHDCSKNSLPLPSLSYGVPAANSYSASLASLNTNIAGAHRETNYDKSDLQIAYSQTSNAVSNGTSKIEEIDERSNSDIRAKSLSEAAIGENELLKSQVIDLNNIPLQGALGSYTLQIQSANGETPNIPHNQVLNDGLLQSILNAIEQPQQNTATILSQPLLHLQQIPPQSQQPLSYDFIQNHNNRNVVTKNIVVTPPPLSINGDKQLDKNLALIDNNEIALYFNNNEAKNRDVEQYGSYVTFKSGNSNYTYGDSKLQQDKIESIELKMQ
ncbi:hypothetical protein FQA39_LY04510 [Lamprigera yunnana]|nr:hypothetical protein FQA39_LY04510 [Lamprigera yunnana]